MSSLNLRSISKSYGNEEILKKINLDINDSEFLVVQNMLYRFIKEYLFDSVTMNK